MILLSSVSGTWACHSSGRLIGPECGSPATTDYRQDVTAGLNAGRSHVDDISDADVREMLLRGFRAAELLNAKAKAVNGSAVLLLGVTYKPDIADQRETPVTGLGEKRLR